jgi:hypothetical protein
MSETDDQANSRLNRYGEYIGKCLQNVAICNESPTDVVLGILTEDKLTNNIIDNTNI